MRWVRALLVAFCALLLGPVPGAYADCSNPAAPEGVMLYNTNENVPQYCDGTTWTRLAPPPLGLPSEGLVAHWKLDEPSGTTVVDSAGTNIGTMQGGLDAGNDSVIGKIGDALQFDGTDDYVTVGASNSLRPPNLTVALWVKRTSSWSAKQSSFVDAKGSQLWNGTGWGLEFWDGSGGGDEALNLLVNGNGYFTINNTDPDSFYPLNEWIHIAATFDTATNTARFYKNGIELSPNVINTPDTISSIDGTVTELGMKNLPNHSLPGQLDDVRIYNRALSAEEIARCCSGGLLPDGPKNLSIAGSVTDAQLAGAGALAVSGKYAYVGAFDADRLTVVDIGNPAAPVIAGSVQHTTQLNGPGGVKVSGNYAYLSLWAGDRFAVVDISNPAAPSIVSSITDTRLDGANKVTLSGNYAYVPAEFSHRLNVIDISNPAEPVIVGSVQDASLLSRTQTVALSGNYAYATSWANDRLTVVDISNPSAPSIVTSLQDAQLDGAFTVLIKGGYAYVMASIANRLTVVDISNPASPSIVGSVQDSKLGDSWGMEMSGDYLYVAARTTDGLTVVDIRNPAAPVVGANIVDGTLLDDPRDVAVLGNYAYMGAYVSDRLAVINLNWNCNDPPGVEGQIQYNLDTHAPMYCEGAHWVALAPDALAKGLVGHWKFDEASGSGTAANSIAGGKNGTLTNMDANTDWVPGMTGNGLDFDNTDDNVSVPSDAALEITGQLTLAAWIKPDSLPANGQWDSIFLKNPSKKYYLTIYTVSGIPRLNFGFNDGIVDRDEITLANPFSVLNVWYHVAATYNDSTNEIRMYVNGQEQADNNSAVSFSVISGAGSMEIGEGPGNGVGNFDGGMDDLRIYNRALSAAEVAALHKYGLQDDGLIAHWPLNEQGGKTANDMAGDNIGYASGGVVFNSSGGQIGGAATFDGVDDLLQVGDPADGSLDFGPGQDFSVAFWLKRGAPTTYYRLFAKNDIDSTPKGWGFYVSGIDGGIRAKVADGASNLLDWGNVTGNDTNWHHHVFTFDRDGTVAQYADGAYLGNSDISAWSATDLSNPDDFCIGTKHWGGTDCRVLDGRLNGNLDDIRIYNRALSAAEIAEIHAAGAAGFAARDCTSPDGAESVIIYNLNENAPQYCDGARWVRMGGP